MWIPKKGDLFQRLSKYKEPLNLLPSIKSWEIGWDISTISTLTKLYLNIIVQFCTSPMLQAKRIHAKMQLLLAPEHLPSFPPTTHPPLTSLPSFH
jgi:hypothetical protein